VFDDVGNNGCRRADLTINQFINVFSTLVQDFITGEEEDEMN
jgi:hypothetical protein